MNNQSLATSIKDTFINSDKYLMDKHVPTFEIEGKFLGDFFSIVIVEPQGEQAPIFYHTFSPYDVISKIAPDRAVIYQAGKLLLETDFADYVVWRTGVMSPMLFQALGINSMQGKRVLFIGTGKIAKQALGALKDLFPDTTSVSYYNPSNHVERFIELATSLGIKTVSTDLSELEQFDYIICHSSAKEPVITAGFKDRLKPGAIITTFGSEDHIEIAEELYDSTCANVLVDWEQTCNEAIELRAALEHGLIQRDMIVRLRELFTRGSALLDDSKYTIFRSHGTPIQNLAVLKLLLAQNSASSKV